MISNPFQIRRWAGEAIDFSGNIIAIAARMDFCNRCENVATIVPITINCDFYSRFSNLNRTSRHLQAKTPWNHARSTLQWSHKPSTIMRHASSISFKYNFSKISLLLTMSPSTVWMTKFNEVPERGGGGGLRLPQDGWMIPIPERIYVSKSLLAVTERNTGAESEAWMISHPILTLRWSSSMVRTLSKELGPDYSVTMEMEIVTGLWTWNTIAFIFTFLLRYRFYWRKDDLIENF